MSADLAIIAEIPQKSALKVQPEMNNKKRKDGQS